MLGVIWLKIFISNLVLDEPNGIPLFFEAIVSYKNLLIMNEETESQLLFQS